MSHVSGIGLIKILKSYFGNYQNVVILQLGPSTSVLEARPNHIHGLPVGGRDVANSSNSFALRWWGFSSEVEKLKRFCFDFALKLALYT